jgi:hypothetical protein
MSTPKRITVQLEPELYEALRRRALDTQRSVSELVNEALRSALGATGVASGGAEPPKKGSAAYERLVQALKRRRQLRPRSRPPRS